VDAAKAAVESPLLEVGIDGAKGILFTITGGPDLTMYEVNEAARIITASADPNAKIIFGAVIDESLKDQVKVTVIATGFSQGLPTKKTMSNPAPQATYLAPAFLKQERLPSAPKREAEPSGFHERNLSAPTKTAGPVSPAKESRASRVSEVEDDYDVPAFIRRKLGN
jgi:cell division GTPase FtsZ